MTPSVSKAEAAIPKTPPHPSLFRGAGGGPHPSPRGPGCGPPQPPPPPERGADECPPAPGREGAI